MKRCCQTTPGRTDAGLRSALQILLPACIAGFLVASLMPLGLEAKPKYVVLFNSVSDGRQLELCGQTLDDPLPMATQVTPLDRLLEDGEDGEGVVEVQVPGREGSLSFPVVSDDDDGFCVQQVFDDPLAPGKYPVFWRSTVGRQAFAPAQLRVLDPSYTGPLVVSDIDLTYLQTDFSSASEMTKLLKQTASEKVPFPGMPEVYRGLQAHGEEPTPMVFMSGSPGFFRPTLEARLALDGIRQDLLLLKPFGAIVKRRIKRGKFAGIVAALKEQVAYKLERLIDLRMRYPVGARQIMLGDDSEADHIVYGIYRDLLSGALKPEGFRVRLEPLEISDVDASSIEQAAVKMLERQAGVTPRVEIYIRRVSPGRDIDLDPDIRGHEDSFQLALALLHADELDAQDARRVGRTLGDGVIGERARVDSAQWAVEHGLVPVELLYDVLQPGEMDLLLERHKVLVPLPKGRSEAPDSEQEESQIDEPRPAPK